MPLILILMLLMFSMPGEAGAGEYCPQPGHWSEDGKMCVDPPVTSFDLIGEPRISLPGDCEWLMEAAMRAMEPFIAKTFVKDQDGLTLSQVLSDTQVRGLLKAGEQWEVAKRECWK